MKFSWKSYFEPTPKNLRKFADALLVLCLGATACFIFVGWKILAIVFLCLGAAGKFGINFFAEE